MLIEEIFYSVFWISAVSVVWFYTDWFIHYTQLLGIVVNFRLEYLSFVIENPDRYFPDFLREKSIESNEPIIKFLGKIVSCPLCLHVWLSIICALLYNNFIK